jgi:Ca-activated chloride channel family protein
VLQFEYPWAFGVALMPVLMYWLAPEFRDRGEAVRAPFFARLVSITGASPRPAAVVLGKTWMQKLVWLVIWVLIVISLARPQWVGDAIVRETSARDMLLIVDLSGSMEAQDFTDESGEKISRLEAVKVVLDDFIARRNGDRLGLAIFGNAAFLQASFTDDHRTVRALLDELQVRMAGPQTMIGDSLGLAIKVFNASESDNKVVILLTDGNDTGSQMPVARAATIAAKNGITIHSVAIGDPTTIGESALDIPVLQEVSDLTGGQFFLGLNRQDLAGIYAELDRIEPELIETLSYRPKRSLFHYPLGAAMAVAALFSLLLVLLGRRRRMSNA